MRRLAIVVCSLCVIGVSSAQERGIVNHSQSPHVKLKGINIGDCQWRSGLWADKFKLCQEVMVPHMGSLLKGDIGHAYNNFKITAGLTEGKHQGTPWHDGDFDKWMESAAYVYAINKDARILDELDEIIEVIGNAQDDDGYLSTYVMLSDIDRWSNRKYHELYNSGISGISVDGTHYTLATKLQDGSEIKLKQETQYPWDGSVKITVEFCKDEPFEMLLRIPDWAEGTKVLLNGKDANVEAEPGTYAQIERRWKPGDVIALEMPMDITLLEGHPRNIK